jgi:xanthine dehydrogenase accessory factor
MGDCIMPREGVFAVVLAGGVIRTGDEMELIPDDLYQTIADRRPDTDCILATIVDGPHRGEKRLWMNGIPRWTNTADEFFRRQEQQILSGEGTGLLTLEETEVFCEHIGSQKKLVICGAGHVSIPIIQLGRQLGFQVTVIDDRPLFANHARNAQADQVFCDTFAHAMEQIPGSRDTYFVIVTRGHRYDIDCLRMALAKPGAYIGMMGSKKRVALVKQQLQEEGISDALLEKVHAPIGLSIGAETPEEIAVSILAEIIQEKNRRKNSSGCDKELMAVLTDPNTKENGSILCTIVAKRGSAPREVGTKMVIHADGTITGTIGGGCAESSVIRKGLQMLRENSREPSLALVDMTGRQAEDEGMVCGGTIRVYMETI